MGQRDPRIDDYIAKAQPFARPILAHLREVVHGACPEVEETLKWRSPHFLYRGMLCSMAAFKQHAAFGFWRGRLVVDHDGELDAMGSFGRLEKIADLPSKKALAGYVKKAMALNEAGVKVERPLKHKKPPIEVPPELAAAFKRNVKARAAFDRFSPSHRREYVEWIDEAKRPETRAKRVASTLEWLGEGKTRNWKYEAC